MIQGTAKSQIKQKLRGTFREERGDTGISLVTGHRGQRVIKISEDYREFCNWVRLSIVQDPMTIRIKK